MNGLIREYIPKGADISGYMARDIREIEDKLNNRPRKCLNFQTPYEVMLKNKQFKEQLPPSFIKIKEIKLTKQKQAKCSA